MSTSDYDSFACDFGRSASGVLPVCPGLSDLRFNWLEADLAALDPEQARGFVVDARRMVGADEAFRANDVAHPDGPS